MLRGRFLRRILKSGRRESFREAVRAFRVWRVHGTGACAAKTRFPDSLWVHKLLGRGCGKATNVVPLTPPHVRRATVERLPGVLGCGRLWIGGNVPQTSRFIKGDVSTRKRRPSPSAELRAPVPLDTQIRCGRGLKPRFRPVWPFWASPFWPASPARPSTSSARCSRWCRRSRRSCRARIRTRRVRPCWRCSRDRTPGRGCPG